MPSIREGRSGRRRPRTAPDLSPESDVSEHRIDGSSSNAAATSASSSRRTETGQDAGQRESGRVKRSGGRGGGERRSGISVSGGSAHVEVCLVGFLVGFLFFCVVKLQSFILNRTRVPPARDFHNHGQAY